MSNVDRYQVVGNPIAQSKSPFIHQLFAEQTQQAMAYGRECPAMNGFVATADAFFAAGGKGMNVTAPFKLDAWRYADHLTERARLAGAVNTLALQADGKLAGDTTDGVGLVNDLVDRLDWTLQAKRVLIVGAGGAVRGVLQPLLAQQPSQLVIANRTAVKAESLAADFAGFGKVLGCGFAQLARQQAFDVVINATSAGLQGEQVPLPNGLFSSTACAYDMTYSAELTVFLSWAQSQGVKHIADGLGMLVGQAAESFLLWRGVRPDVVPVLKALRAAL